MNQLFILNEGSRAAIYGVGIYLQQLIHCANDVMEIVFSFLLVLVQQKLFRMNLGLPFIINRICLIKEEMLVAELPRIFLRLGLIHIGYHLQEDQQTIWRKKTCMCMR